MRAQARRTLYNYLNIMQSPRDIMFCSQLLSKLLHISLIMLAHFKDYSRYRNQGLQQCLSFQLLQVCTTLWLGRGASQNCPHISLQSFYDGRKLSKMADIVLRDTWWDSRNCSKPMFDAILWSYLWTNFGCCSRSISFLQMKQRLPWGLVIRKLILPGLASVGFKALRSWEAC